MRQIAIAGLCCLFVCTNSQAQAIFDRSRNSVLHIVVEARYQDGRSEKLSEGTGFLITSDGHVLTANHVVDFDIRNATVVVRGSFLLRDETKHRLYVREKWRDRDVALLFMSPDVRELSQTEPLIMGESSSLKERDRVVSMGFPIGAELQSVSGDLTGKVAEGGLWGTNLLVANGSSGEPVFSDVGSVVGIMTSGTGAAGINLFRPIDHVKGSLREVGIRFPEAVGISSDEAGNPMVSEILGAISDRAQFGAIAYATQLKVDGEYRLLQSMLYAEAVQMNSGAVIKISEVAAADEEVILRLGTIEVIGGEDPAYIVWDRVGRAAGGASYSGAAAAGQNGAGDGESGRPGASGAAGGLGEDGVGAPDVF